MARAQLKTFDLGYGNFLEGIQRGQDKADRAREREEDRVFTREQKKQDQDFATSERIAGQDFTKEEAEKSRQQQTNITELSGDIESRQIKERGIESREGIKLQGNIDITKIKTSGELEALRQKERLAFTGGENARDRVLKGELFDKEWVNREKQWMAQLNSTENLADEARKHEKWVAEYKQTGDEKLLRQRFTHEASESELGREANKLALDTKLEASLIADKLMIASREKINNKNIISEALNREKDRLSREGMQKKDIEAALTRMEKRYEFDLKGYKEKGILDREQARIMKEQEADKTYSFDPAFTNKLYEETGLMGFDENEILSEFRGDAEDPKKPNIFSGLATNVQQVLQTSLDNSQRQEVLNALIKAQERFSDPRFYDSRADRTMGHANEAFSNLKGIQNLMQLMGPKGIQAIKQINPNTIMDSSDNIFGPTVPAIKAVGSATWDATQSVINSLIQNMSNLPQSSPATSTPLDMPVE